MTARVPGVSAALETVQVPVVAFALASVQSASGVPSTETVTAPVGVTVLERTASRSVKSQWAISPMRPRVSDCCRGHAAGDSRQI